MLKLSTPFLRRVLWLDAASGVVMIIAHFGLTGHLHERLGLPVIWLQVSGVVVCAAVLLSGSLATSASPPPTGVRLLAVGNFLWVAASLWTVWRAGLPLSTLGEVWILMQAAFVFILAELEWAGGRQHTDVLAPA